MKILTIASCRDVFSYTPMQVEIHKTSNDYTQRDMEVTINDYQLALKRGQFSRLVIHQIDLNHETGEVTVEINRIGENPLKTKKIINPEAQKVREARIAGAKTVKPRVYTQTISAMGGNPFNAFDEMEGAWTAQPSATITTTI
jgi:hypothetical protein